MNNDNVSKSLSSSIITVSIVSNGEAINIVLSDFNKKRITFGRDKANDIVIPSLFVSKYHGFFEIEDNNLKIYDNDSRNGLLYNGKKIESADLKNNDYVRIDNPNTNNINGILMLIKIGKSIHRWNYYHIHKNVTQIGNKSKSDVFLIYKSDIEDYIEIRKDNQQRILYAMDKEVYVNGHKVEEKILLTGNSVIQIEDLQLVFSGDNIIYQFDEKGVRVDVRSVYKSVKSRGKKINILEDINMTILPGKFVAFVGASGVGKTTLMLAMCGANKPTKGQILINGRDLFKNYEELKNSIGYVPQDDIVFDNLTLIDMLRYSADLRMPLKATPVEKERRIKEVLDIVDLDGKENVYIRNLSGGQRKRAGIAVELLADPRLFFLDEPTSGLDPENERKMMMTLRKMADSGRTVILITHNALNLNMCDKVVFFGGSGKVCYDGFPNQAKTFFGVDHLIDAYLLVDSDPLKWHEKYLSTLVLPDIDEVSNNYDTNFKLKDITNTSRISQYYILTRRYIRTILNNKRQLLLLLIQAPLIVFLISLILTDGVFEIYERTKEILFCISLAALYIGLGNSIQEICKERVILRKEHMANLHLSSYILSKITVFIILALLQSILFIYSFTFFTDTPLNGIIFSWKFEMIFAMALTIFSSSLIGLVVSSVAKDESMAMTYVPLLLVPQSLFCGLLFELKGIVLKISTFILCRWSLELFGTTNDLNGTINKIQEVLPSFVQENDPLFEFSAAHYYHSSLIIMLMNIALVLVCYFILRKKLEVKR